MFSGPAIGLYSSPNPFSQTPAGTLRVANNVRFTAAGVLAPRRGFDYLAGATFGTTDSLADAMAFYAGDILLAYDLTKVALYQGSSFTAFTDTFEPVGDNRMRFEGAARSCFFNTSMGLMVWDGVGDSGQPVLAGCPQGLNITAVTNSGSGWMEDDTAVAYRFTICRKDAFGRIVEGPPSGRTTLRNLIEIRAGQMTRFSNVVAVEYVDIRPNPVFNVGDTVIVSPGEADFPAGAKTITIVDAVNGVFSYAEVGANAASTLVQSIQVTMSADVTLWLPVSDAGNPVTEQNFLRVYRSDMTNAADDAASDEMAQCYESSFLEAADIAAGYLTFNDTAPEGTLDVPLYTNTNSGNPDGILAARYQPPLALDIVYWANRMWFANTTNKNSVQVTLLGTGSPDGLQAGDDFTFTPEGGIQVVFAGVSEATAPVGDQFRVYTDGDPGYNIQRTAQGLCQAINSSTNQDDLYAFYVSSEGGTPGAILLVAREYGDAHAFTLQSARSTAWAPQLPDPITLPWVVASDNNRHPAYLWYSQLGRPEAVPLLNYEAINSDNDEILRIFPLHYRLLIFKTDGIYTCTNVAPFSIQKLSAYKLLAPDSVQVLEDRVYALTDQGIITISDAGVVEISNPIDDVFNALDAPAVIADMAARTFGLSYRSERQYLAWCPEKDGSDFTSDNAQAYTLSTLSDGFTRYPFGIRCGAIDPDANAMVVAPTDNNKLWLENKSLTDGDYYDLSTVIGVPAAVSGEVLTFSAATAALIEAGDVLSHSGAHYVVTEVSGTAVTTNGATGWTTGTSITLYKAIECEVEFNKLTAGTPAELKMVQQSTLLFRQNGIHDTVATFSSEITTNPEEVTYSATGWGEFAWGGVPYGSPTEQLRRTEPLPTPVAQCAQLSVGFRTRQALAKFEFLGIDVISKKDSSVNR